MFSRLVASESRLTASLSRPNADLTDALRTFTSEPRSLRVVVHNTWAAEPSPSWTLRIQGGLVSSQEEDRSIVAAAFAPPVFADLQQQQQQQQAQKQQQSQPQPPSQRQTPPWRRLSRFLSRVVVYLDNRLYPGPETSAEWNKQREGGDGGGGSGSGSGGLDELDGFELTRPATQEFNAKIFLHVDHVPPVFRLDEGLTALVGLEMATAQRVVLALWDHCTSLGLVTVGEAGRIVVECGRDEGLRALFGRERFSWLELPQLLAHRLQQPNPIIVDFPIRLSGDALNYFTFTVPVMCDDLSAIDVLCPRLPDVGVNAPSIPGARHVAALESELEDVLDRIDERWTRRQLLRLLASDPVRTASALAASRIRDRALTCSSSGRDPDEARRAQFYSQSQPFSRHAISSFLSSSSTKKQPSADVPSPTAAAGST